MSNISSAALPYHEPDIITILTQSSFLLVLNAVNHVLDSILYCGLIGQVFVGVAWGTPGARWLGPHAEEVIVQLGYLGLILLVYEGGLSTSIPSLKANLLLSLVVAITGISVPIALSFSVQGLVGATPLQAFAAGAALCSTSLGTTFTVLASSGLTHTRLAVVLTSAAMMDDVVGLVMVQVIFNMGDAATSLSAVTVLRPVLVSLAFAGVLPLTCRYVALPLLPNLISKPKRSQPGILQRIVDRKETALVTHTLLLIGLVTGATYAGTSNLFLAYLAGASVSWWDSEYSQRLTHMVDRSSPDGSSPQQPDGYRSAIQEDSINDESAGARPHTYSSEEEQQTTDGSDTSTQRVNHAYTGSYIYATYYKQVVERVLKPLPLRKVIRIPLRLLRHFWSIPNRHGHSAQPHDSTTSPSKEAANTSDNQDVQLVPLPAAPAQGLTTRDSTPTDQTHYHPPSTPSPSTSHPSHLFPTPRAPLSLYPATILGSAMVARGEIGFLVSSIAASNGVFSAPASMMEESRRFSWS